MGRVVRSIRIWEDRAKALLGTISLYRLLYQDIQFGVVFLREQIFNYSIYAKRFDGYLEFLKQVRTETRVDTHEILRK